MEISNHVNFNINENTLLVILAYAIAKHGIYTKQDVYKRQMLLQEIII